MLTWNFKHINNAQIKRVATEIIQRNDYKSTTICTPEELSCHGAAALAAISHKG
jgi:hypothetical protein